MRLLAAVAFPAVLLASCTADNPCLHDADCKGARICNAEGRCVDPAVDAGQLADLEAVDMVQAAAADLAGVRACTPRTQPVAGFNCGCPGLPCCQIVGEPSCNPDPAVRCMTTPATDGCYHCGNVGEPCCPDHVPPGPGTQGICNGGAKCMGTTTTCPTVADRYDTYGCQFCVAP
jgi:hypothetical protein